MFELSIFGWEELRYSVLNSWYIIIEFDTYYYHRFERDLSHAMLGLW